MSKNIKKEIIPHDSEILLTENRIFLPHVGSNSKFKFIFRSDTKVQPSLEMGQSAISKFLDAKICTPTMISDSKNRIEKHM